MVAGKKSKIIGVTVVITLLCIIITVRVLEGRSKSKSYFLLLGVCIVGIISAMLWVYCQHGSARRVLEHRSILENNSQQLRFENSFLRKVAGGPLKFHYKDIEEATDNFESLIGRDGTEIAVKIIERGFEQGEREFLSEVAAIGSIQHVNLVRLLGYSTVPGSGSPRLLVYEYIHNNFRALIADFRLSRLMGKDESRIYTTLRGTRGYLAPEWLLQNGISEKSDIYSYDTVLFEIIDTEMIVIDLLCIDQDEPPTVVAHQIENGVPPQSADACSFAFTCISGR
ncbi:hypothetical protein MKX01_010458 [Papaver californicum]|nr:hypothetical protein MKX01_010458 [Papaver californicum]